jgi:DNA-binding NtrC family response regulator
MVRILIVDDMPKSVKHLARAVERPGSEVVTAASAKEAIQRIVEETFDVVVTDLRMETNEAGLEVLKAAIQKDAFTQVIVITAYGTPKITAEAMLGMAFDFLERNSPLFDIFEVLKRKVTLALEFRDAKLKLRESGVQ